MRKRNQEGKKEKDNTDRWLLTYADVMNNLLILFMVLYAMSVIDASKFAALAAELANAFSTVPMTNEATQYDELVLNNSALDLLQEDQQLQEQFDKLYETINSKLKENGYDQLVSVDKGDNFIRFRFGENVLFYPDSPIMKTDKVSVLKFVGDTLAGVNSLISTIEIGGHTATTGQKTDSFFSWELSSDRAIAVLEYLVTNCYLPESKMTATGFSRYHPVAKNDTEANRKLNRRVEITITRVIKTKPPASSTAVPAGEASKAAAAE
ncbi:MAG: flagellar motor protein MotB [Clostridia bacterium]|nr:flagellar motor protein MotB [Clostridia bacterium]MDD4798289.1 flagellar motor protein MotB [Clostridia bacterium]